MKKKLLLLSIGVGCLSFESAIAEEMDDSEPVESLRIEQPETTSPSEPIESPPIEQPAMASPEPIESPRIEQQTVSAQECVKGPTAKRRAAGCHGKPLGWGYAPSYNCPGAIAIHRKACQQVNASFFADASFTYWYLSEEGLRAGTNGVLNDSTLAFSSQTNAYFPSFDYYPGFKVGVGVIHANEWVGRAEYTWVHGATQTSQFSLAGDGNLPAGSTTTAAGTAVFVVDDWFLQGSSAGQALAGSALSSKWTLNMNIVDLTWGRPWYQGKRLIISPRGGIELAFLEQNMSIALTEATGQLSSPPAQPIHSRNKSHSWGVGCVAGADCKTLFSQDFYLEAGGSFALLYTGYTVEHSEDAASTAFNPGAYGASYKSYRAVRPSATLDIGLGWGRYLCCNAYYVDFAATYEFSIYWAQNMMRKLLDDILVGTSAAPPDLFTQGLTLTGAFHF